MTTQVCSIPHNFCKDCIVSALRKGNKERPSCRTKLVSKQSCRPNPDLDYQISQICQEYEEELQERELAKQNLQDKTAAQGQSIMEGWFLNW